MSEPVVTTEVVSRSQDSQTVRVRMSVPVVDLGPVVRRLSAAGLIFLFGSNDAQRQVGALMDGQLEAPQAEATRAWLDAVATRMLPRRS